MYLPSRHSKIRKLFQSYDYIETDKADNMMYICAFLSILSFWTGTYFYFTYLSCYFYIIYLYILWHNAITVLLFSIRSEYAQVFYIISLNLHCLTSLCALQPKDTGSDCSC